MRRFLLALTFAFAPPLAHAWNAAGHRLVAVIAWQQLSPSARQFVETTLARHPDHAVWATKAGTGSGSDLLAEASTWPDDIRGDARFYDAGREPATPPRAGLPDTERHKPWHYVDLDDAGRVQAGELDRQIERLGKLLRRRAAGDETAYALPWLVHLVADIHQPLHVGRHGDEGGNSIEIENPFNKRQPVTKLHVYWDELPGPPWLRGSRLERNAARLLERYPPPLPGDVAAWRAESHRLLERAYPATPGNQLPIIDETFHRQARDIASRRLVEAGYRLGWLLEDIAATRVSRETH